MRKDIEENNGMTITRVTLLELSLFVPSQLLRRKNYSYPDWQKGEMGAIAMKIVVIKLSHPHRSVCRVDTHSGQTSILDGTPNYKPAHHRKGEGSSLLCF